MLIGPLAWHSLVRLLGSSSQWWFPSRRIWQKRPQNTRHCWKKENLKIPSFWSSCWLDGIGFVLRDSHTFWFPLNTIQIGVENINPWPCQIWPPLYSTIPHKTFCIFLFSLMYLVKGRLSNLLTSWKTPRTRPGLPACLIGIASTVECLKLLSRSTSWSNLRRPLVK